MKKTRGLPSLFHNVGVPRIELGSHGPKPRILPMYYTPFSVLCDTTISFIFLQKVYTNLYYWLDV